jgi:hypothetical protein
MSAAPLLIASTVTSTGLRITHLLRSDAWIATTWNNMSDPGAFAVAGAEEQEGGEPTPLAGAGLVVCLMG